MTTLMSKRFENFNKIKSEISECQRDVTLVAISKFQTTDKILPLLDAGHRCFGESRLDEAINKWGNLRNKYENIELHFIGGIQSRKIKDIVGFFDVIQSVDRISVAKKISSEAIKIGKTQSILIQINIGEEPQKSGVAPQEFASLLTQTRELKNISIAGIMCIPPNNRNAEDYFEEMNRIALKHKLHHLSMGMSNDYISALKCNATMIRIGSLIFGERVNNE